MDDLALIKAAVIGSSIVVVFAGIGFKVMHFATGVMYEIYKYF